jgi:hypothetical protein
MCQSLVHVHCSPASRRLAMPSSQDSCYHSLEHHPASCSIAALLVLAASQLWFVVDSWWTLAGFCTLGPFYCIGHKGHVVLCVVRRHTESAGSVIILLSRCMVRLGKYLLLAALNTCLPSWGCHTVRIRGPSSWSYPHSVACVVALQPSSAKSGVQEVYRGRVKHLRHVREQR